MKMYIKGGLAKAHSIRRSLKTEYSRQKIINLIERNKISRVEGLTMFYYISYTKITIFIQIIRFKMIQIGGQGFSGFGRFFR